MQGVVDPTVLEAMACREALALAADLQLTRIKVACDCLEIIKSMEGNYLGKFSVILQEIRRRAGDFASVLFVHERRSSNLEAHGLARSSAYREHGRHMWLLDSPDEFCIPKNIMS
jgi:ribonuclease HI